MIGAPGPTQPAFPRREGAAARPRPGAPGRASSALARPSVFAALHHREYRLLWLGSAASHTGEWAQQVALGWLVLSLTDSAFCVALAGSLRSVPQRLFTLPAGVLAARSDRRTLLAVDRSCCPPNKGAGGRRARVPRPRRAPSRAGLAAPAPSHGHGPRRRRVRTNRPVPRGAAAARCRRP